MAVKAYLDELYLQQCFSEIIKPAQIRFFLKGIGMRVFNWSKKPVRRSQTLIGNYRDFNSSIDGFRKSNWTTKKRK